MCAGVDRPIHWANPSQACGMQCVDDGGGPNIPTTQPNPTPPQIPSNRHRPIDRSDRSIRWSVGEGCGLDGWVGARAAVKANDPLCSCVCCPPGLDTLRGCFVAGSHRLRTKEHTGGFNNMPSERVLGQKHHVHKAPCGCCFCAWFNRAGRSCLSAGYWTGRTAVVDRRLIDSLLARSGLRHCLALPNIHTTTTLRSSQEEDERDGRAFLMGCRGACMLA